MSDHPPAGTPVEHQRMPEVEAAASGVSLRGHPLHPMLVPLPIGLFVAALLGDIGYVVAGDDFYARAAFWATGLALASGLLATIAGLADLLMIRRARQSRAGIIHGVGNGVVMLLGAVSYAGRLLDDPAAFVVPWGVALSALIAALLAVTGWYGGEMSYRMLIGASPSKAVRTSGARTEVE